MSVDNLVDVIMPQFGESVDEAFIVRWMKSVGERVEEFEPLVEVNTDKIDVEVPSPATGILSEIFTPAGSTSRAGTVVAVIAQESNEPQALIPQPASQSPVSLSLKPGRDPQLGFISPVVARLSEDLRIDLRQVTGTGQAGRITKQDVLAYEAERGHRQGTKAANTKPFGEGEDRTSQAGGEVLPLSPLRRAIAERMSISKQTIPHVTTLMEADLSRVMAHRNANKETFAREGVNLTYTAYFTAVTVEALKAFPMVNASWNDQGIILHKGIHIGIAVSLGDDGLVVPVIKNSASTSLTGLARSIADLSARARSGKLTPEDVQGATFSITNHGVSGSLFAIPAINPPQCGILGIGAAQKRVVVVEDDTGNDAITIRTMVYLSFTFDHRILDGAIADHFLAKIVSGLENWE